MAWQDAAGILDAHIAFELGFQQVPHHPNRWHTEAPEDTELTEEALSCYLDTGGLPDPDLLIRSSGEFRVSNFLLWQLAYSEIYITEALWPDFGTEDLHEAIRDYQTRHRRFGGLG